MYEPEVTIITPTYNIVESGHADDFRFAINQVNTKYVTLCHHSPFLSARHPFS